MEFENKSTQQHLHIQELENRLVCKEKEQAAAKDHFLCEIAELKRALQEKEDAVSEFKKKAEAERVALRDNYNRRIEELKTIIHEERTKITEIKGRMEEERKLWEHKYTAYEKEKGALHKEAIESSSRIAALSDMVKKKELEINELRSQLKSEDAMHKQFAFEKEKERYILEEQCKRSEEKIRLLKKEFDYDKQCWDEKLQEKEKDKERLNREIAKREDIIREERAEIHRLRNKLKEEKTNWLEIIKDMEQRNAALKTELEDREREKKEILTKSKEEKNIINERWIEQVNSLNNQRKKWEQRYLVQEERINQLLLTKSETIREKEKLEKTLHEKEKEVKQLEEKLGNVEARTEKIKGDLDKEQKLRELEISKRMEEIDYLKRHCQTERAKWKERETLLEEENNTIKTEVVELSRRIHVMEEHIREKDFLLLKKTKNAEKMAYKLQLLQNSFNEKKGEMNRLTEELKEKNKRIQEIKEQLKTEIKERVERHEDTKRELEHARKQLLSMKKRKDLIETKLEILSATLSRLKETDKATPKDIKERDEEIKKAKDILHQIEQNVTMWKDHTKGIYLQMTKRLEKESIEGRPQKGRKETKLNFKNFGILVSIGAILITFLFVLRKEKEGEYPAPYSNPSSIMWDGKNIWSGDWYTKAIVKHNMDKYLSILEVCYPDIHPSDLAWDGKNLWSCDGWNKKIYKHKLDTSLSIIASYESPGTNPAGLAWDGQELWSLDADTRKIYRHNVRDDLSIEAEYNTPGDAPSGIFWDGERIWTSDSSTNRIYKHNMDERLSPAEIYTPEQFLGKKDILSGMTWDGKHIWTIGEKTNRIYRHSVRNLKIIKKWELGQVYRKNQSKGSFK